MLRPIRALIVSDAPDHAELLSALRRADFDPSSRHTSTFEGFTAALAGDRFDIVFADANARGVPATHALEVLKRGDLNIPCLVVSDVAREDVIVDMMRAGAADYLVTNNWARLAQRVDRALGDAAACRRGAVVGPAAPPAPGRMHLSGDDVGHQENVYRAASGRKEHVTDDGARQRLVLDTIPQIVWMAGADGSTHYLNRSGAERLGVPAEAIDGWYWLDWLHPDDVNRARDRWEVAIRETGDYLNEYRLRQADGTYRWYLAQAVALRHPDGDVTEWVGTWTDITERKWTEERLVQDATLLGNVLDSLIVTDLEGLVTYWNEGATQLFGWTGTEMVGQPLLGRFPEHMRPQIAALTGGILDGQEWAGEFEDYRKDGSRVWIDARVTRMTDAAGQVTGVIGVARDISRRKQAEAERDRLLAQLRVQIDRMPLGYLLFDAHFRIVDWNPAAERLFGYRKDEMIGLNPVERLLPAAAVPQGETVLHRLQSGDMAAHAINENLTKDGRTITCEWHNTPLFDGHGAIVGFLSLAQDISDRQRAEEGLRASEQRFRQIAESIREVFWLTDPLKQEVVYVSPAYETIWGRTCASVYASPAQWWEAIHTEDRAFVLQAVGTKQLRGDYDEQYRIVRPDGTIRWIRDRAFPVRDVHGQVVRVAGVAEDITERRQLEAQLGQAQKMEAVGQLAGGVAHDFNNFLTIIASCTYLLLDSLREDEGARELVHQIMRAGERSGTLTRQLLSFSRQQVLAPKIVNLNTIIRDTESMLRRAIGEDIEIETILAESLGSVRADPGQMEQVLLNLVVNAHDAMPQGGTLTIETTNVQIAVDDAATHPGVPSGPYVRLAVTDSGSGMTETVKRHLFEPFFTTKGPGEGTGLGLAVVHGVIRQSDGHIVVLSEEGAGTTFHIYLPRLDDRPSAVEAPYDWSAKLPQGNETVLLVEDEPGVRALASLVLEQCGYRVLEASGVDEAMRLVAGEQAPIHLLVVDVVMPGGGGRVLTDQLRVSHPEIKVLFISGYADDAIVRHGILHDQVDFLQKPFAPPALALKVREVLDRDTR